MSSTSAESYSFIFRQLNCSFAELEFWSAFTYFQLITIIEDNHHYFLVVEHDSMLYERARDMAGRIAQAMRQAARGGVLLYAPVLYRHLEAMVVPVTGSSIRDWKHNPKLCKRPRTDPWRA